MWTPSDWSIATDGSGDIRYVGSSHTQPNPSYATVQELYSAIIDLLDEPECFCLNPPTALTPELLTLDPPWNIDGEASEHLYAGSIKQHGGDEIYTGVKVLGFIPPDTIPYIIMNGQVIPPFWLQGLNADPAHSIVMDILVKTRANGEDLCDELILRARKVGWLPSEFIIRDLGHACVVGALTAVQDVLIDWNGNNATPAAEQFDTEQAKLLADYQAIRAEVEEEQRPMFGLTPRILDD